MTEKLQKVEADYNDLSLKMEEVLSTKIKPSMMASGDEFLSPAAAVASSLLKVGLFPFELFDSYEFRRATR